MLETAVYPPHMEIDTEVGMISDCTGGRGFDSHQGCNPFFCLIWYDSNMSGKITYVDTNYICYFASHIVILSDKTEKRVAPLVGIEPTTSRAVWDHSRFSINFHVWRNHWTVHGIFSSQWCGADLLLHTENVGGSQTSTETEDDGHCTGIRA